MRTNIIGLGQNMPNNKTKAIHFYTRFINHKSDARSFLAIKYLEANHDKLGINKGAIESLKKAQGFYHHFSHPGEMSLASMISYEKTGKAYICGWRNNHS